MYKIWEKIFGNMKVLKKMLAISIFAIISLIVLSTVYLIDQKEIMKNEKKNKLVNIIDLSYSILEKEYENYKIGKIDEKTAKQNALHAIKELRYGSDNYIWINDDTTPYPKMVVHPNTSLDNKILNQDIFLMNHIDVEYGINGKIKKSFDNVNMFKTIVNLTNQSDEGFISYLLNLPDSNKSSNKLSYVKKFKPWHWILGTGISVDDLDTQFYESAKKAFLLLIGLLFILCSIFWLITKEIVGKVNTINEGLEDFFSYLNREKNEIDIKKIISKDEFGQMSKLINANIEKTKIGIEEDKQLINETISVLGEFEQGDLCQRVSINVSNPAMMQLKEVLNKMAQNLEFNIDNVLNILEKYTNFNYLDKVNTSGIKKDILKLANGVNSLGDSITDMLIENKSNGLTLEDSSNILLKNVGILNESSTESASSLEETAAAIEEITSNIRNNGESISTMAQLSNSVISAAKEGEGLATHTVTAMNDINKEVTSISESITVIDQIAFQTNILSLNAAVEAATAGEAGKGFAVVAQEVRNLASRSAEAAKEIKNLVENATLKANSGKSIADDMIIGYETLNSNISKSMELISNIEISSKEQLTGIEQINDAITQLDQQTQNNASVAFQTNDIAISTDSIAKLIVNNANEKEFKGKDIVKVKKLNNHKNDDNKENETKEKLQNKIFVSTQSDDSKWKSF